MASYSKYENDFSKYSHSDNVFKQPKSMIKEKELNEQRKENLKRWITFYRRNIHKLCEHYFGIKLHLFQKLWLYLMGVSEIFVTVGSRGID